MDWLLSSQGIATVLFDLGAPVVLALTWWLAKRSKAGFVFKDQRRRRR